MPSHELSPVQKICSGAQKIDLSYMNMDEEEARQIGEAIASSQTLEELTLQMDSMSEVEWKEDKPGPYEIILTTAFLGSRPNTSVHTLIVEGSGTDGDMMKLGAVSPVIRENTNLSKLEIRWCSNDCTTRSQIREFLNSLLQNSTLRTLVLPRLVDEDEGSMDAETFSQIVKLVEENKSIDHLELFIGECQEPGSEDVSLPGFYAALKSNSTIKTLRLQGDYITQDVATFGSYLNWIRETRLKELHLEPLEDYYEGLDDGDIESRIDLFVDYLRNNKNLKKLVVDGTIIGVEELKDALISLQSQPSLEIVFEPENDRAEAAQEQSQAATSNLFEPKNDRGEAAQEQSQAASSPEDPDPIPLFLRCLYLPTRCGICRCFCFICYC